MNFAEQFPPIPKQESTRLTYLKKGEGLYQRMATESASTDTSVVVASFLATSARFSQRTFRLYKAYLLEFLEHNNAPPSVLKELREASSKHCAKRGGEGTSGRKLKSISPEESEKLLRVMREIKSRTATIAADYLEAGLLLGPRPVEWVRASISVLHQTPPLDAPAEATHSISFINAKRDEAGVRGNGDVRTLYVQLTGEGAALVTRVIEDATRNALTWEKHYEQLRASLRYAARKCWPRRKQLPCFYTTRHQSQANAKAAGMPPSYIAAMFGHASDNTSTKNYARKSQGDKNMCIVSPSAVSLAQVRNQPMSDLIQDRRKGKNL